MTQPRHNQRKNISPWAFIPLITTVLLALIVLPHFSAATGPDYHINPDRRFVWGENVGWISLNCDNLDQCASMDYKVSNANGTLSGFAWGENVGWIDFAPANGGVTIDSHGDFHGAAWGENIGWIIFDCDTTNSCDDRAFRLSAGWYANPPTGTGSSSASAKHYVSPDWKKGNLHITNIIQGKEKQGTTPDSYGTSSSSVAFTPIFPPLNSGTQDPDTHPSKNVFLNRSYTRAQVAKATLHAAAPTTIAYDPAVTAMETLLQNLILPLLPNNEASTAMLRTLDEMHGMYVTVIVHEAARHDGQHPAFPALLPDSPSRARIGALLVQQFGLPVPPQLSLIGDSDLQGALAAASYGIIDAEAVATPSTDHATFSEFALMIQRTETALLALTPGQKL